MGLYDRPYYQDEYGDAHQRKSPLAGKPLVFILIGINVIVFFANFVFGGRNSLVVSNLAVTPDTIVQPWMWWKFLTYGFAHDPQSINHLLFNMIGLFFFGQPVEQRQGRMEFLRFYLLAIVLGGVVWSARHYFAIGVSPQMVANASVVGASGGVVALTMLFVFWYPQTEIYLMMVLPVKAWVVGVMMIAGNLFGMGAERTAFDVHLVGIAFACVYHYQHWNLGAISPAWLTRLPKRGPRLKIHDPDRQSRKETKDAEEAERILEKIHRTGEESLSGAERKVLERHSRRLRERR